jgi:hypothetical protein
VARKFCPETIGLWIGGTGLGGLLADDLLDQAWRAVPTVPGQIHADILQVTLALVTVCAVFRWAINPVREAFIFGWHARGEHDERRRGRDGVTDACPCVRQRPGAGGPGQPDAAAPGSATAPSAPLAGQPPRGVGGAAVLPWCFHTLRSCSGHQWICASDQGADGGTRTPNLRITSALAHHPVTCIAAGLGRFF